MYKRINFTIPEYLFNEYFGDLRGGRSQFICKLIWLGYSVLTNESQSLKNELARLVQELQSKEIENRKLNFEIESLKNKLKTKKARFTPQELYSKALKNAGILRGDLQNDTTL